MSVALPSPRVVTVGTLDTLSLVGLRCVRRFRLGLGLGEEEEEPAWQVWPDVDRGPRWEVRCSTPEIR